MTKPFAGKLFFIVSHFGLEIVRPYFAEKERLSFYIVVIKLLY